MRSDDCFYPCECPLGKKSVSVCAWPVGQVEGNTGRVVIAREYGNTLRGNPEIPELASKWIAEVGTMRESLETCQSFLKPLID